jgi:hypothetical protein
MGGDGCKKITRDGRVVQVSNARLTGCYKMRFCSTKADETAIKGFGRPMRACCRRRLAAARVVRLGR